MNQKTHIALICGTTRPGSQSLKVANFIHEELSKRPKTEVRLVDPRTLALRDDGNASDWQSPEYAEIVAWADAFYIVTPEYNRSFPGSLKRLLDLEYGNYLHKAVALTGVSSGSFGGARAVEALLPVLHNFGLYVVKTVAYFPNVQDDFDDQARIKSDKKDVRTRAIQVAADELIWLANALKVARNKP